MNSNASIECVRSHGGVLISRTETQCRAATAAACLGRFPAYAYAMTRFVVSGFASTGTRPAGGLGWLVALARRGVRVPGKRGTEPSSISRPRRCRGIAAHGLFWRGVLYAIAGLAAGGLQATRPFRWPLWLPREFRTRCCRTVAFSSMPTSAAFCATAKLLAGEIPDRGRTWRSSPGTTLTSAGAVGHRAWRAAVNTAAATGRSGAIKALVLG